MNHNVLRLWGSLYIRDWNTSHISFDSGGYSSRYDLNSFKPADTSSNWSFSFGLEPYDGFGFGGSRGRFSYLSPVYIYYAPPVPESDYYSGVDFAAIGSSVGLYFHDDPPTLSAAREPTPSSSRSQSSSSNPGSVPSPPATVAQRGKPDWQEKLLDILCSSEEGRKAVQRLKQVPVHVAESIHANIEINGTIHRPVAGGFFSASENAVYLNIGGQNIQGLASIIVHESIHVQQFIDLGFDGFRSMSRTDKEVPAYSTQEQFHIDMGWPAFNRHTRRNTGFLGRGWPAVDVHGIRRWQDGINRVGKYLDPTIKELQENIGGWECPD